MTATEVSEIEALEILHKDLVTRRDTLRENKSTVVAELGARRRTLKNLMDEAKAEGFDPDNLQEEIRKGSEVLRVKLSTFEADIEAGEKQIRPMLDDIRKS